MMSLNRDNLVAVVVLFHPHDETYGNLGTYLHAVDRVIAIDNSEDNLNRELELKKRSDKIDYLKNDSNLGIARALNQGVEFARKMGAEWLLTMDQDSRFEPGSVEALVQQIGRQNERVGIYTPVHVNKDVVPDLSLPELSIIKKTMTSGNLVRMKVFDQIGLFEEKLFIDYVDHDFNFRLLRANYSIIRCNRSLLKHALGNIKRYGNQLVHMKTTNHSALRRYYITRNRLYVICNNFGYAPKFFFKELQQMLMDAWRVLLLERDKKQKFKSIARGVVDWAKGRYGKFER